ELPHSQHRDADRRGDGAPPPAPARHLVRQRLRRARLHPPLRLLRHLRQGVPPVQPPPPVPALLLLKGPHGMTETNKGGRPSIGTQITVTLPNADLKTIDEMAAKANVRRPDVIREIVHDAVSAVRRAEAAGAPLTERLQP